MPRTKRIIKFEDSIIYNFIFFDKRWTIYSSKIKSPTMVGLRIFKKRLS
tara:strand:+ start:4791 stop:4937 length:147 start_codon:yes stop_codon:yes gene_type:complete